MFKINFDLFYELNNGSIISIHNVNEKLGSNSTSFYRIRNNNLEVKLVDNLTEKTHDWDKSDCITLNPDAKFKIEERFPRNEQ